MARPTPVEAALLRSICATPADDLPRLVYADWLEENGRSERAEFIRLQIGLSEYWPLSAHKKRADRIEELFNAHKLSWLQEIPKWARYRSYSHITSANYSRGFIRDLCINTSPFLQFGWQVLDRIPLQTISFVNAEKMLPQLAKCPWLGRLPALDFSYMCLKNDTVAALAGSPFLRTVNEINLRCSDVTDRGATALANSRFLRSLKVLNLGLNNISIGAVKVMAHSPNLQNLEQLDLTRNRQLRGHEYRIEDWFGKRVLIHDEVE